MHHQFDNPSTIGSTSSSLVERIRTRDQDAWRRLVRLYGPLVDYWVRRAGLQPADAEDVFQEVFRAVAANIGSFRKDAAAGSFRGWLRTITRSKVADLHRRQGNEPRPVGGSDFQRRLQLLPAEADADDENDEQERRQIDELGLRALELVRSEFEARTWEMFRRVAVDGHDVADVAADMGVTPSAVRLAKSRVLRRLRDELAGLEP